MLRRLSLFLLLALAMQCAGAERIKDLVTIAGVRNNQLVGYGLVVGLTGTGDQTTQTPFTVKSLKSMLSNLGVTIPPEVNLQLKNVAAVSLQAELPPFAKPGQTIDVTVSSIGNAKSLRGGSLMMAPLKGVDGAIYAIAQGNVVVGGLGAEAGESKITINVPSAGRIPNGATVERQVPDTFGKEGPIVLNLRQADFTTAERIVEAVNKTLGGDVAQAIDATSIQVRGPAERNQRVSLISVLENIEVVPAQTAAKVIVNSRTGTIVIGQNVKVGPAAVSHGNMTVTIAADPKVSQPAPLSRGQTVVVPNATIAVDQEKKPMFLFNPGIALDDIVRAVNQVGASPSDLVAILEALKAAGALKAELIVI
ncbi:MAG TPA: flagellar basal body P-ring protein FlgI [Candidatus Competibacter sp.]|nr:flagellar basal body P-ring protein FlgI [Candidatus Competibacteraceae bacterium]HRE55845.1 flagellar basal body P-ring protein FlgI [Candidatus Competibacter sp.]HUM95964.1 flagellar basal body P-ring protein FlgI [Candidatus Competibacter sp.]